MLNKVWYEIIYKFPNLNGAIGFGEWIHNLNTHFIMDVIIYRCWDQY